MLPENRLYNFNVNRAKLLRRNTEDMMFKKLRLKKPKEQLIVRSSRSCPDFLQMPGFIVTHNSKHSEILLTHRNKINYLMKYIFEAFFPHTNDILVKKILYIGLILDTRKHYVLNIDIFQEIMLARDISLILNDEEMITEYEFLFSDDTETIQNAKTSFKIKEDDCFLPDDINITDVTSLEKIKKKPKYKKKITPNPGTEIFPLITDDNFDFIKREHVEKKLFKKYKLKVPTEKLVVNTNVRTTKIINYPGFDLIHSIKRSHIVIKDREKINYVLKFVYEMFCPRENPIVSKTYLYKEITIHDVTFATIAEDDFERIYPFMKNALNFVLIHNEEECVVNYLFTFVDDLNAKSNDEKNINQKFIDTGQHIDFDIDKLEADFDNANLFDMDLYKTVVTKKKDVIPKILTASAFKIQALNASLIDSDDFDSEDEDTDDDEDTEWQEGLDEETIEMKKKEKKLIEKQLRYAQTVESLILKRPTEKGPIIEAEPEELKVTTAPVKKPYKVRMGPAFQRSAKQNVIKGDRTFPSYGDFDALGFRIKHHVSRSVVEVNEEKPNKNFLIKFLLSILILKHMPQGVFQKTPYKSVILDGIEFSEFSEEYTKACLVAKSIELVWDDFCYAPDYHI